MAEEYSKTIVTTLEKGQESLFTWLAATKVTSDKEQKDAEDLLIVARRAVKDAEAKRKDLTQPLDESKARIIALFKPYIERLNIGIKQLNDELGRYHEQKRIAAEAERLTELAKEAARIREAGGTGEVLEPLPAPITPAVPKTSHTHLGTVSYRDDFDIQIVDPSQVPRDLCEPSMPKIRARVKSGVLDIPGVLIARKTISTARGK